jgi:hypothetical protein
VVTKPKPPEPVVLKPVVEKPQPPLTVSREFTSGKTTSSSLEYSVTSSYVAQDVTLSRPETKVANSRSLQQVAKPGITQSFRQGSVGMAKTDTFKQMPAGGILDVLVVVDNSGSMDAEQKNLASKLSSLLGAVQNSDWQIGVVTTDPANPCLRGLIKKGDSNATAAFAAAVSPGIAGTGAEQGVRTAAFGLGINESSDPSNPKVCSTRWLRPDSSVAVLIVSDEDNCSTTDNRGRNDCGSSPWKAGNYLTDYLGSIRTLKTQAKIYGIIWVPNTSCSTAYSSGVEYQKIIDLTGGVSGSICDDDYSQTLNKISTDVVGIIKSQFSLKMTPDAGSAKVYVNDSLISSGYTLSGTTLTFMTPPAAGATIVVTYSVGAAPRKKLFQLSESIAPGSVEALIDGAAVDGSSFVVDYKAVTFADYPADNSEIRITYRKEIELGKIFEIGARALVTSIAVKVNGSPVKFTSYDADSGALTLETAPPELAMISINYDTKEWGSPVTKFSLMPAWMSVHNLSAKDKTTGESVNASWADGIISIDPAAFLDGRVITVSYLDESMGPTRTYDLPNIPVAGSLSVIGKVADGTDLACPANLIKIDGQKVQTLCDISGSEKIVLSYKYVSDLLSEVSIPEIEMPDSFSWSVYIDGVLTMDFTRIGTTIKFKSAIPAGAKVKVVASRGS